MPLGVATFETPASSHEAGTPETYLLGLASDVLVEGKNVLAIEGHNTSYGSTDFSFIPGELFEKLEFTAMRKVKVDESGMTSIPGVFAGGDIVNINMDAVTAISDAKIASQGISRFVST